MYFMRDKVYCKVCGHRPTYCPKGITYRISGIFASGNFDENDAWKGS